MGVGDFDEPGVAVDFFGFAEEAGIGPPEEGEGEVVPAHAALGNGVVGLEGGLGELVAGGVVCPGEGEGLVVDLITGGGGGVAEVEGGGEGEGDFVVAVGGFAVELAG